MFYAKADRLADCRCRLFDNANIGFFQKGANGLSVEGEWGLNIRMCGKQNEAEPVTFPAFNEIADHLFDDGDA